MLGLHFSFKRLGIAVASPLADEKHMAVQPTSSPLRINYEVTSLARTEVLPPDIHFHLLLIY